jgi:hypothetical protein
MLQNSAWDAVDGRGTIALVVFRSSFLDQQRLKATGPTNLTRLAHPMMLNDASGQVPRYKWLCDREAAIWTTFVSAVWRRITLRGSRSGHDAMPPLPIGAPMKLQWIDDDHLVMRFLQSLGVDYPS